MKTARSPLAIISRIACRPAGGGLVVHSPRGGSLVPVYGRSVIRKSSRDGRTTVADSGESRPRWNTNAPASSSFASNAVDAQPPKLLRGKLPVGVTDREQVLRHEDH